MKVIPQKTSALPKYPTKSILDEHPELLYRVPERWVGNPTVMAALAGVGLLISGCKAGAENGKAPQVAKVAPVFVHGEGRGTFGCIVVNPPVFLSEEEAREVISQEAKKAGISFDNGIMRLDDVIMPPVTISKPPKTNSDGSITFTIDEPANRNTAPVELDGTNNKRDISFEFVSMDDSEKWEKMSMSTVQRYTPKDTADVLKSQLAKSKHKGTYAVFYEPFVRPEMVKYANNNDWRAATDKVRLAAKEKDREQLRKQVQDFIKWLKAEGIM